MNSISRAVRRSIAHNKMRWHVFDTLEPIKSHKFFEVSLKLSIVPVDFVIFPGVSDKLLSTVGLAYGGPLSFVS